ncbi:MAG TPA: AraC family transcriptional regulator [Mucilaginibacter sp.]|jgi:AraC family L-rhamnose operon regulatory protein RhaS|nr:AraC family transcriptional regulator [Mucilaginibacter sp.]
MRLFQDIEITIRDIQSSVSPPHRHHYFELLYILEGAGSHTINNNQYPYSKGNLFLLTPDDTHSFEISSDTRCCIIDFTKGLFAKRHRSQMDRAEITEFFVSMEYIFHNHQNLKGYIAMNQQESGLTNGLVAQLIMEKDQPRIYSGIITQNIVFLLLNIIARSIQENIAGELKNKGAKNIIHELTTYIQQNIYKKELLKIDSLAKHFNKTPDHLNRYFKQQTGITLKTYINRYKLRLVETRLRYSDLNISEIANELGYTDESHLNKIFKSAFGQTAKEYRKIGK